MNRQERLEQLQALLGRVQQRAKEQPPSRSRPMTDVQTAVAADKAATVPIRPPLPISAPSASALTTDETRPFELQQISSTAVTPIGTLSVTPTPSPAREMDEFEVTLEPEEVELHEEMALELDATDQLSPVPPSVQLSELQPPPAHAPTLDVDLSALQVGEASPSMATIGAEATFSQDIHPAEPTVLELQTVTPPPQVAAAIPGDTHDSEWPSMTTIPPEAPTAQLATVRPEGYEPQEVPTRAVAEPKAEAPAQPVEIPKELELEEPFETMAASPSTPAQAESSDLTLEEPFELSPAQAAPLSPPAGSQPAPQSVPALTTVPPTSEPVELRPASVRPEPLLELEESLLEGLAAPAVPTFVQPPLPAEPLRLELESDEPQLSWNPPPPEALAPVKPASVRPEPIAEPASEPIELRQEPAPMPEPLPAEPPSTIPPAPEPEVELTPEAPVSEVVPLETLVLSEAPPAELVQAAAKASQAPSQAPAPTSIEPERLQAGAEAAQAPVETEGFPPESERLTPEVSEPSAPPESMVEELVKEVVADEPPIAALRLVPEPAPPPLPNVRPAPPKPISLEIEGTLVRGPQLVAAEVAQFVGAVKTFEPASFIDLLDASLGLGHSS